MLYIAVALNSDCNSTNKPHVSKWFKCSQRQIKSLVKEVQEAILQQEPRLAKAMVPVPTLHITLLVSHLGSEEQGKIKRISFTCVAELVRRRFEEQGLLQGDCRDFEPHLTIMKLSRASKLRFQGIKRVEPGLYSDYTSKFFGNQTVERLDLCSMLKKKQQDGYYHTETSLQLGKHSQCESGVLYRSTRGRCHFAYRIVNFLVHVGFNMKG
uniref:A-kinase anchor protein 7-like phosphoesterase domain-containing protein n=1 Tax=Xiphophorus couchianus TaxID=32473 RepID=A0A3B5LCX6_9TELE